MLAVADLAIWPLRPATLPMPIRSLRTMIPAAVRPALVAVFALTLFTACGGGGDGTTTPPTGGGGTIALTLGASSGTVTGTGNTATTITLTRSGSFTGTVALALEGAPTGVTGTFTPATLGAGVTSSALALTVAAGVTPGAYPLTVRATGTGVSAVTAAYALTVASPPLVPGFTLAVTPGTVTVVTGESGSATVAITRNPGFAAGISLVVSGVPQNVQVSPTLTNTPGNSITLNVSAQLTAAPGTYPLVITGTTNSPITATTNLTLIIAAPGPVGTLTPTPATASVVQGQSANIAIAIARGAGVTGDVVMSVDNLPSSITAAFSPNPVSGSATTLMLTASLSHPVGVITVQLRATIGNRATTVPLQISTGAFTPRDFGIAVTPAALGVTVGQSGQAAVAITRTGNFTGDVSFTVLGAPAGVAATVTPSPTAGNSATLNVATTGAATPGTYPLTISATGTDITGTRTANATLTVNAFGGGNIQWRFCAADREPVWLGVRTGAGAWSQVAKGANVTYNVPLSADGQVAYVIPSGAGFNVSVFSVTPQDALQLAANECATQPARKTISGTVSNLPDSRGVQVMMGGGYTFSPPITPNWTMTNAGVGVKDLLAITSYPDPDFNGRITDLTFGIIRRDLNPAAGSVQPVFNFDAAESFSISGINESFQNVNGEQFTVTMSYLTANGRVGTYFINGPAATTARSIWGLPTAFRRASDLHEVIAITSHLTAPRLITRYTQAITGAVDPAFGPLLDPTTVTVVGSGPVRLRATGTWQPEYNWGGAATFTQSTGSRSVTITGSRAALGAGASYTLEIPDFTGVPGWNPTWMLQSGIQTAHTVSLTGIKSGAGIAPADGTDLLTAQRIGTITP